MNLSYLVSIAEQQAQQATKAKEAIISIKTANWIKHNWDSYECSLCHNKDGGCYPDRASKYCPDCGAKMVDPQESEDRE